MNKITSEIAYGNDVVDLDSWQQQEHPWTVVLSYQGRQMTVPFWTSQVLDGPDTAMVVHCLLSDAREAGLSFEDWADVLGFNNDSRKAERTYLAVVEQTARLREFLGADFEEWMDFDEEEISAHCD